MLGRLLAGALALAAFLSSALGGTFSSYTAASTRASAVTTPPLLSVGVITPVSSDRQEYTITGIAPAGKRDYLLNIRGDGSGPKDIAFTVTTSSSTLLDTASNGLHVEIARCSTLWQQSVSTEAAKCNATTTVLVASAPLSASNTASPTYKTSGLSALTGNGVDHLRVRFSVTAGAPAEYEKLTSTPTVTIYGASTPGAPTALSATVGEEQATLSWTAPASTGNSAITGYTVTATPSGRTCTTPEATTCTITGLTDGEVQTITVTATNVIGTGSASTALSTYAYPASVMSGSSGLSLWLDGADSSTRFLSSVCSGETAGAGQAVGCWKDKSAAAENFTQGTEASRPTVGTIGSLSAMHFTSQSQVLTSINATDTYQTVFLVSLPLTNPSEVNYLFGESATDFAVRIAQGAIDPEGTLVSPTASDWSTGTGTPTLAWTDGKQAHEPGLGSAVVIAIQSNTPQTYATSVSDTIKERGYLGQIGEVIAYSGTLTATQRQTVENYLARKWLIKLVPEAPGTPTLTPGDGTIAASWTAPSYNGGAAITGYTATASPSGKTCSTSGALTCTISGLTDGEKQAVTVKATNSVGAGPASASASATPFPSILTGTGAVLWLDGQDPSTLFQNTGMTTSVTEPGQPVAAWKDKSGKGNNVIAPGTAPLASTEGFGSRMAVAFKEGAYLSKTTGWVTNSNYTELAAYRPTSSCAGNLVSGQGIHAFFTDGGSNLSIYDNGSIFSGSGGAASSTSYVGSAPAANSNTATKPTKPSRSGPSAGATRSAARSVRSSC
jgi:Fibronectin type III domain